MSNHPHFAAAEQILIRDAQGEYQPASADQILDAARRVMEQLVQRGTQMSSPTAVRDYLTVKLAAYEHEMFAVLFLDNQHRLIEYVEMFRGSIDSASVHPREVVKEALARNAAAVILSHNHPSGWVEPSEADKHITNRLRDALSLVDIRVLDHVVVAGAKTVSFAERGLV